MRIVAKIKLKHGIIAEALSRRGMNQAQGAKFMGMNSTTFSKMINMDWVPKQMGEEFINKIESLCGCDFLDVFPEQYSGNAEFIRSKKSFDVTMEADPARILEKLGGSMALEAPIEQLKLSDTRRLVQEAIDMLTKREAYVIREIFEGGKTLREISEQLGVTSSRVMQIKNDAMDKLKAANSDDRYRHTRIAKKIREAHGSR